MSNHSIFQGDRQVIRKMRRMFRRIGSAAATYRYHIIAVWVVAAALLILTAPPLDDVSSTDQRDFLPTDAPFATAQAVFEATFPAEFASSSTVILIDAGAGGSVRAVPVWDYMAALEAWLTSAAAPENIAGVAAPTSNPDFADLFISSDQQIALVSVAFNTPTDAVLTTRAVQAIEAWLHAHPPQGFSAIQTGEAALNAQAEESTFTTMDRTLILTFALVIIALLVIYRSPVSPLIPLFSVTIAFIVTLGLIGHLAQAGVIKVIAQVNALLVVVMYGAGTDYCLFLISRFREEMADETHILTATQRTVQRVGETISSSAGTVFVGFMAMSFAQIGMIKNAGPMLALGIVISLLAGLTLTPALLATLGNRAFWPGQASHRAHGRWYDLTSRLVSERPLLTIVIIIALMLPFSVYGLTRPLNYDFVAELPEDIPSVRAYHLLREHMGGGTLFPLTVIVTGRAADTLAEDTLRLNAALAQVPGVVDIRSLNAPLGSAHESWTNLLRVDGQLRLLTQAASGSADLRQIADLIPALQRYLALLAARFPLIADDPNWLLLREIVDGGLIQIGLRQDAMQQAAAALAARFEQMPEAELLPPAGEGDLFAALQPLLAAYVAAEATALRIDVILDNPLDDSASASVHAIRELLRPYQTSGAAVVSGFPAVVTDLKDIMSQDTIKSVGFVLVGIFIVLLIMLRSVVAPAYLILTVLLSFTCTLGITALFFRVVFGVEALSWLLPFMMFVFLIGLGIDYSIFLFGRIKEEVGQHGIREGIHVAVAATGAIITSAGVILAGTFAGMVTGEIAFLQQMGFAVSVGVLLDAFVVRTMLDPALATLFGQWTWFPGGVPGSASVHAPPAAPRAASGSL